MSHRLIHSLRTKPKAARDRIALGAAGSCTAVLLLIWLVSTPGISANGDDITDTTGAFGTLLTNVKEQIAGIKSALPDKDTMQEVVVALENDPLIQIASTTASSTEVAGATTTPVLSSSTASTTKTLKIVQIATTSTTTQPALRD